VPTTRTRRRFTEDGGKTTIISDKQTSSTNDGKDKSGDAPRRERRRFAETANDSVTSKTGDMSKTEKPDAGKHSSSDEDDSKKTKRYRKRANDSDSEEESKKKKKKHKHHSHKSSKKEKKLVDDYANSSTDSEKEVKGANKNGSPLEAVDREIALREQALKTMKEKRESNSKDDSD